jgi:catechol 2,3-dioxygenase-like lactoylglutathione lyase family enzyme
MGRTGQTYSTARAGVLAKSTTALVGPPIVMVPITDMTRAITFYRDAIGLPLVRASSDGTWAELGDAAIGLHPAHPTGVDTGLGFTMTDVAAACERIRTTGGRLADGVSPTDPVVTVHDPDGNVIRLLPSRP